MEHYTTTLKMMEMSTYIRDTYINYTRLWKTLRKIAFSKIEN